MRFSGVLGAFQPYLQKLLGIVPGTTPLPKNGVLSLVGLKSAVRIHFDDWGVAHIAARNEHDLFFAQGYYQAADRFWQMELTRRLMKGRVSELVGDAPLGEKPPYLLLKGGTMADFDHLLRVFRLERAAQRMVEATSEESLERLASYIAGINRRLEENKPPAELRLLGVTPEPWTMVDSMLMFKAMCWDLAFNWRMDLAFHLLGKKAQEGNWDLDTILPFEFETEESILRFGGLKPGGKDLPKERQHEAVGEFFGFHGGAASNSWVISGKRSASGKPIVCNDPHLFLRAPAPFQEIVLECPEVSLAGAALAGTPGIAIGTNGDIAWGITSVMSDEVDLYIEEVNPENPDEYKTPDGWKTFEFAQETIKVKNGSDRAISLRETRHGPVISDALPAYLADGHCLAFRWPSSEGTQEMEAWHRLARAKNWEEFRAACSLITAPASNIVYADKEGNIGYQMVTKIPIRKRDTKPGLLTGATDEDEWLGTVPFEALPHVYNPESGIIVTANNRTLPECDYPYYITSHFEPPHRAQRISELLLAKDKHSVADMERIQTDVKSLFAEEMLGIIRPELRRAKLDGKPQKAAAILSEWDCHCTVESLGATIFHVTLMKLMELMFVPVLGEEHTRLFLECNNHPARSVLKVLQEAEGAYYHGMRRGAFIVTALEDAIADLTARLGEDTTAWRWGSLHKVKIPHAFDAKLTIGSMFSVADEGFGGDPFTINVGCHKYCFGYDSNVCASVRFIYDFGDIDNSKLILPTGVSGSPLSPHYQDQYPLWRDGEYKPFPRLSGGKERLRTLLLTPA